MTTCDHSLPLSGKPRASRWDAGCGKARVARVGLPLARGARVGLPSTRLAVHAQPEALLDVVHRRLIQVLLQVVQRVLGNVRDAQVVMLPCLALVALLGVELEVTDEPATWRMHGMGGVLEMAYEDDGHVALGSLGERGRVRTA